MSEAYDKERLERGYEMMDAVYGPGASGPVIGQKGAFIEETVGHLFGDIWSRPHLNVRERRLLVLGATAALGRKDLVEIQIGGALDNEEFTGDQLDEAVLMLAFYVGWGNASATWQGIVAAQKAHAAARGSNDDKGTKP